MSSFLQYALSPRPAISHFAAVLVALLALGGCGDRGESEFRLDGIERHQGCLQNASRLRPPFNTAWIAPDSVSLFFQTDTRLPGAGDAIFIQIYQPDYVRAHLGEPIELADPRELQEADHSFETPPVVRATAAFAESCPNVFETFGLLGTVIFKELGDENGKFVVGELVDGQVISLRDQALVAQKITGTWDLTIKPLRPYQFFPPLIEEDFPDGPTP